MRKLFIYLNILIVAVILFGCEYSSKNVMKIIEQRDSLLVDAAQRQKEFMRINEHVGTINEILDSLEFEEKSLVVNLSSESPNSQYKRIRNLDRYAKFVRSQQNKINELEKQLENSQDTFMINLVSHMKKELNKKDVTIKSLRKEIQKKQRIILDKDIQLSDQQKTIDTLNIEVGEHKKALIAQDEMLNKGYVLIDSKKELQSKGVVKRGKIVSDQLLDKSIFMEVDIRNFKIITFEAKRPKILSDMPKSSYTLEHDENNYTLTIKDVNAFWSISSYLIIQTNSSIFFR